MSTGHSYLEARQRIMRIGTNVTDPAIHADLDLLLGDIRHWEAEAQNQLLILQGMQVEMQGLHQHIAHLQSQMADEPIDAASVFYATVTAALDNKMDEIASRLDVVASAVGRLGAVVEGSDD